MAEKAKVTIIGGPGKFDFFNSLELKKLCSPVFFTVRSIDTGEKSQMIGRIISVSYEDSHEYWKIVLKTEPDGKEHTGYYLTEKIPDDDSRGFFWLE